MKSDAKPKITRERKKALKRRVVDYCGELLVELVGVYSAFEELPRHEQDFIDKYIVSIGEKMIEKAEKMP